LILCLDPHVCGGGYPQHILTKAAILNNANETFEWKYYFLYNKILNYWFPSTEGYDLHPQWGFLDSKKSIDFAVTFVVEHQEQPLLLVEIKAPSTFKSNTICLLSFSGKLAYA